ncbi:Neil3 [Symbiodinium pilosum]|uniref:Neil3 protein n=1 Tax=Symbiodinium pilosum TaxID=2952 RepID=A0A812W576_SYMPI|nr:Neil3 [Symbiodinium pilosum]
MPLADIEKLTVKDFRITMEVRDQKKPVEFQVDSSKGPREFSQWASSLEKLLSQRLGANFVSSVSADEGAAAAPEPASSDGGHASASVSGGTTPRDAPRVLCEGELLVLKKNREDPRYCVLRTDCFEYFSSKEDYQTGVAARARALIEDITSFEVLEGGIMEVELGDKKLAFKALSSEDLVRWQTAWETDPDELIAAAEKPQTTMPTTTPLVAPAPKARVVTSGKFSLRGEGSQATSGMLVLREDRLEFFKGRDGKVPDDQVPDLSAFIQDIEDLEVLDDTLAVRLLDQSRTFELFSPQGKSMEEWYSELQHVFSETGSTANSHRDSVVDEDPKANVTLDEEAARIAKDLVQAVKTVNVMFKTARTLNGHKVQNEADFHRALQQADSGQVNPEDLAGALKDLGIGLTDAQIESLIFSMDQSEGGGISLDELKKVLLFQQLLAVLGTCAPLDGDGAGQGLSGTHVFSCAIIIVIQRLLQELFIVMDSLAIRVHFGMSGGADFRLLLRDATAKVVSFAYLAACEARRPFDILSPNFDFDGAIRRLKEAAAERKICDLIMDQLLLPGVGNVIKDGSIKYQRFVASWLANARASRYHEPTRAGRWKAFSAQNSIRLLLAMRWMTLLGGLFFMAYVLAEDSGILL